MPSWHALLAVSLREGGNILRLGEGVQDVMRRAQRVYPVGIDFELLNFQPRDVELKINTFVKNLGQAVFFVAAIMLVFLGVRTGLIVAGIRLATIKPIRRPRNTSMIAVTNTTAWPRFLTNASIFLATSRG